MKHILFDTDIGTDVDDAFALVVLAKLVPDRLLGVVTTNGPTRIRALAAKTLLTALNKKAIPAFEGISRPKTKNAQIFVSRKESDLVSTSHIVKSKTLLTKGILRLPDRSLIIITAGPLTTLAWLLVKRGVAQKIDKAFIMGGVLPKNNMPRTEHNFTADPIAAQQVLEAQIPIFLVPLNVTLHHTLPPNILDFKQRASRTKKLLHRWANNWFDTTKVFTGEDEVFKNKLLLHDPLTCLAALHTNNFSWKPISLSVDNHGFISVGRGNTISVCTKVSNKAVTTITRCFSTI